MSERRIELFVMPGCPICPQMERLFRQLQQEGLLDELEIIDITQHPQRAQELGIRSAPSYLVNGVLFSGLKHRPEIEQLLQQGAGGNWRSLLSEELSEGGMETARKAVLEHEAARDALFDLLEDADTPLVVRIGLSAIIEELAERGLLEAHLPRLLKLAQSDDERIALDGLYYLSMLKAPQAVQTLSKIAESAGHPLQQQARELLQEQAESASLH
jgi:predicted thioredoxin/glutaredoxin